MIASYEVEQLRKLEIEVCVEAELDEQWSFVREKSNQMLQIRLWRMALVCFG